MSLQPKDGRSCKTCILHVWSMFKIMIWEIDKKVWNPTAEKSFDQTQTHPEALTERGLGMGFARIFGLSIIFGTVVTTISVSLLDGSRISSTWLPFFGLQGPHVSSSLTGTSGGVDGLRSPRGGSEAETALMLSWSRSWTLSSWGPSSSQKISSSPAFLSASLSSRAFGRIRKNWQNHEKLTMQLMKVDAGDVEIDERLMKSITWPNKQNRWNLRELMPGEMLSALFVCHGSSRPAKNALSAAFRLHVKTMQKTFYFSNNNMTCSQFRRRRQLTKKTCYKPAKQRRPPTQGSARGSGRQPLNHFCLSDAIRDTQWTQHVMH